MRKLPLALRQVMGAAVDGLPCQHRPWPPAFAANFCAKNLLFWLVFAFKWADLPPKGRVFGGLCCLIGTQAKFPSG